MNRIARRERGFKEGENFRDSVGLEKQLNNVRYNWQGIDREQYRACRCM